MTDILTHEQVDAMRDDWNMACLSLGIPAITQDTSARLMAVLYVHGNNELMTHHRGFLADVRYIQLRFHMHGTGTPPADFAEDVQCYVRELEDYIKEHPDDGKGDAVFKSSAPKWATDLFKNRYGIKLIN